MSAKVDEGITFHFVIGNGKPVGLFNPPRIPGDGLLNVLDLTINPPYRIEATYPDPNVPDALADGNRFFKDLQGVFVLPLSSAGQGLMKALQQSGECTFRSDNRTFCAIASPAVKKPQYVVKTPFPLRPGRPK